MGYEKSFGSDGRGVSNVVAVTLLVGLTLVGVITILVVGYANIGETNQQANIEVAEETMLQVESVFQQTSGSNTTIPIPDQLEGNVAVSNDQTYNLTLNENPECSTGSRPLSGIEHEENGEVVAYEGGGVWRMTESGATMVSPPDVTYDEGSVALGFVEIDGQIQATSELRTAANTTEVRTHQYNLSRALYMDGNYSSPPPDGNLDYVCRPRNVENATLQIENSEYARAWADWAEDNHDSTLVTLETARPIDAGDTVTIRYSLGDVSESNFEVSDVEATRSTPSDSIEVFATVTNTGGLRSNETITFDYGTQTNTTDRSIGGGDSKRITFKIPERNVVTGPSGENMTFSTPDDSDSVTLTMLSTSAVPDPDLDDADVPRNVTVGTSPDDANLTVSNGDGMTAFDQVTMTVDGDVEATWNVTVGPGETAEIPVGNVLPTDNTGEHNVTFRSDTDESERESIDPFTVGENGYFRLNSVTPPYDVRQGQTLNITAQVSNTGAERLEGDVWINVTNLDTGATTNEPERDLELDGTVLGAESETVWLEYTPSTVGNYSYEITTPNETRTGLFYAGPASGPRFDINGLRISDNPVEVGNQTTVAVDVLNSGDRNDTQRINLTNEATGTVLRSEDKRLTAGSGETISWTLDTGNSGYRIGGNDLNVSTENTTAIQGLDIREDIQTIEDANGTVTVNVRSDVRITMEGAEFEGRVDGGEYPNPTNMTLVINNSTGVYERPLWRDTIGEGGSEEDSGYQNVGQLEPNDDRSSAADVGSGAKYEDLRISGGGDRDMFAVEADAGQRVSADIRFPHEDGDLDLRIVDNDNWLDESYSVSDNESVEIDTDEEGTYYVWVYGYEGATNTYDLDISTSDRASITSGVEGDVNHPLAERSMQRDDISNPYTTTLSVEANTTLGLYASTYGCDQDTVENYFYPSDYVDTGIDHPNRYDSGSSTDGHVCRESEVTDAPLLEISNDTNPGNVAIFGDGERVPAYLQASPYQLTLEEMLGDRIDDGRLALERDERVFLYELSEQNADTADADEEGDPDYNDAIARFQVVSINRTVNTEPEFIFTDYNIEPQVDQGDVATLDLTVANIGGQNERATVGLDFYGTSRSKSTDSLATGETDVVSFDIDTTGVPAGGHEWVATTADDSRSGFISVGEPPSSFFQVTGVSAPPVADIDDSPVAALNITNTGRVDDRQDVVLEYRNEGEASPTWQGEQTSLPIDSGNTVNTTLPLPTTKGNYSYRVETDNVTTTTLDFFVGESNVYVPENDSINIGTEDYDRDSLIEREGGAEVLSIKLENNGTVGDERDIRLMLENNDGKEVFNEVVDEQQVGGGNLAGDDPVPAFVDFDTDLGTGYYTYEITVYNDTTSESVAQTVSGELYLRDVTTGGADDDSPITIDSGTITVK